MNRRVVGITAQTIVNHHNAELLQQGCQRRRLLRYGKLPDGRIGMQVHCIMPQHLGRIMRRIKTDAEQAHLLLQATPLDIELQLLKLVAKHRADTVATTIDKRQQ